MPALNFQAQFAALVESRKKRQTVRAKRKDGRDPKKGDTLYLFSGMRTKNCRRLGTARCESVREIMIYSNGIKFAADGDLGVDWFGAYSMSALRFARADGFDTFAAMLDWIERLTGSRFSDS